MPTHTHTHTPPAQPLTSMGDGRRTVWRWRKQLNIDRIKRLKWSLMPLADSSQEFSYSCDSGMNTHSACISFMSDDFIFLVKVLNLDGIMNKGEAKWLFHFFLCQRSVLVLIPSTPTKPCAVWRRVCFSLALQHPNLIKIHVEKLKHTLVSSVNTSTDTTTAVMKQCCFCC